MATRKPIVVRVDSDTHCGSSVGICPPKVRLADGGAYEASPAQGQLWEWWMVSWDRTDAIVREQKAHLISAINGDVGDNPRHHGTSQSISGGAEAQEYVTHQVYNEVKKRRTAARFVMKGTPAHSGSEAGDAEEQLGEWLRAERDENGQWSSWHRRMELHGWLLDFQHHGAKVGGNPRNKPNTTVLTAYDIWANHVTRGLRPPDIAVRSHLHTYMDTEHIHPTRLIVTPSWQNLTAFAHKLPKVANDIPDFGSVLFLLEPGNCEVIPLLYTPELPEIWHAA